MVIMIRGKQTWWHWCPACLRLHPLPDNGWTWNASEDKPTFSPSFRQILAGPSNKPGDCHYFLKEGQIEWCGDSYHNHVGTEPMPEIPEDVQKRWREMT